jgi:hypothetical protein
LNHGARDRRRPEILSQPPASRWLRLSITCLRLAITHQSGISEDGRWCEVSVLPREPEQLVSSIKELQEQLPAGADLHEVSIDVVRHANASARRRALREA